MVFRNVGNYLVDDMASQPKGLETSAASTVYELQNLEHLYVRTGRETKLLITNLHR